MAFTRTVNQPPEAVAARVAEGVQRGALSAELTAQHRSSGANGAVMIVLVFDKYFMRTSNRASLTVSVDNLSGSTTVFAASAGTSEGLFSWFDWGAASSFESEVEKILRGL